jgi:hypothetical protein
MSGINDQDARALTYLAMRVRAETYGAGPWDEHGTAATIANLKGRSLAMTTEHIIRHASDPKAKTPGVLLGAFTPSKAAEVDRRHVAPKRDEACDLCGGWKNACPCSRVEAFGDKPEVPRMSRDQALATARAALTHAKHTNTEEAADA